MLSLGTMRRRQHIILTLPVQRGYYRLSLDSTDVRLCPDAASNCDGAPVCRQSTSGCRGTGHTNGAKQNASTGEASDQYGCAPTLTGVFCTQCLPDLDGQMLFYSAATNTATATCKRCQDTLILTLGAGLGILAVALLVAYVVLRLYRDLSTEHKQSLRRFIEFTTPHVKLKIVVACYQILTKVDDVYEITMPYHIKQMLRFISFGISLGIGAVNTPLQCLNIKGYYSRLMFFIVTPFVCLPSSSTQLAGCTEPRNQFSAAVLQYSTPMLVKLGFLSYPLSLQLHSRPSDATRSHQAGLQTDPVVEVGQEHQDVVGLAWVAIAIYPIGQFPSRRSYLSCERGYPLGARPH